MGEVHTLGLLAELRENGGGNQRWVPEDRWILTWGGMVQYDSKPLKIGE
jgi:hypothetical protein